MKLPQVITEKTVGSTVVQVLAYRKVTESEFKQALQMWFATMRRKTLPKNQKIIIQTTFGQF